MLSSFGCLVLVGAHEYRARRHQFTHELANLIGCCTRKQSLIERLDLVRGPRLHPRRETHGICQQTVTPLTTDGRNGTTATLREIALGNERMHWWASKGSRIVRTMRAALSRHCDPSARHSVHPRQGRGSSRRTTDDFQCAVAFAHLCRLERRGRVTKQLQATRVLYLRCITPRQVSSEDRVARAPHRRAHQLATDWMDGLMGSVDIDAEIAFGSTYCGYIWRRVRDSNPR